METSPLNYYEMHVHYLYKYIIKPYRYNLYIRCMYLQMYNVCMHKSTNIFLVFQDIFENLIFRFQKLE